MARKTGFSLTDPGFGHGIAQRNGSSFASFLFGVLSGGVVLWSLTCAAVLWVICNTGEMDAFYSFVLAKMFQFTGWAGSLVDADASGVIEFAGGIYDSDEILRLANTDGRFNHGVFKGLWVGISLSLFIPVWMIVWTIYYSFRGRLVREDIATRGPVLMTADEMSQTVEMEKVGLRRVTSRIATFMRKTG